jgi:prepilin-type N-terminal cleavage/methylation domain-containing protein
MRPVAPRRSSACTVTRGYTVVEVLLSLTVLAIGASAVMSMQKAALQGNLDARKTDMANSIARMWVERIRRDATQWTLPSPVNPSGNNFASAQLLQYVGTGWVLPSAYAGQTPPVSPGFDMLGRDIANASGTMNPPPVYCVNVQETYVFQDGTNAGNNLIRADVRVVWVRGINPGASNPCAVATTVLPSPQLYQSIYMTTVVRANGLP